MVTRVEQVEQVGNVIRRYIESGTGDHTLADVTTRMRAKNDREGWTFETSGPMDSVIRHEDVVLSESELTQAIQYAWEHAFGR